MRVAFITESFLPSANGVTNSVARSVDHLALRGHQSLVIAPGPGEHTYGTTPVVRTGARCLRVYPGFPVGFSVRRLVARLRDFDPDVVHLASPIVLGAAGVAVTWSLGIPTIAVYQTDLPRFAAAYRARWAGRGLWHWIRTIHNQADLTLAPSVAAANDLDRNGVRNVAVWRRGVDLDQFSPTRRSESLRAGWAPNGETVVGYVGRLAPEKEVHHLSALADVPGIRVVVVGDGPNRAALERRLPDAVFAGFRTGHDLAACYASLDVFVHTGASETFCQTVQEALASGVPALAPDAGGPRDLIHDGVNGYRWCPGDASDLRRVVTRAIEPDTMMRMAQSARPSVAGRTWESIGDELLGHYRSLVSAPAVPV